ncbi:MAG: MFS transporter [Rhodobacteraceae bacterium]|nr:MFS transporter [Paracoccaceae bacterium]
MKHPAISQERHNVIVLVLLQATAGAQMPIVFIVAGLAGQSLAPNVCWATLPISVMVFGSMTTAPWLSNLMQRFGRRVGFWIGCLGGVAGGCIGSFALLEGSFLYFLLAAYASGIYMSANGMIRFAAADTASAAFRPRAISYVLAGGLLAAVIGPQLVKLTHNQFAIPFLGSYLAIFGLNALAMVLIWFLDIPVPKPKDRNSLPARSYRELIAQPRILIAVVCAMVSYALMNLVMTSAPLAVVGCGFTANHAADIVSLHVLAMFGPAFFTGHLISRFGAAAIVAAGLFLLALAGVAGLSGVELPNFYASLILLGIGWNFSFIGATNMLVEAHEPHERGRAQGMNDMMVFGLVTVGSLASGTLMNCTGGTPETGWNTVIWAMVPFLLLASMALLWHSRLGAGPGRRSSPGA